MFCTVLLGGDQIENSGLVGACGTYVGKERCMEGFGGENCGQREHLEEPGIEGWIILRWIFRK